MQEGSLRCDANVNVHVPQPGGGFAATPIVEVKNLNSFRAVERATKFEAQRQYEQFLADGKKLGDKGVSKATAGWDEHRGVTVVQRRKEEAADYRYFPEPDLVPVRVDDAWLARTRAAMGELPSALRVRLAKEYGLSAYDANVLTGQGRAVAAYFEETAKRCGDAKAAANWVTNQVLATLKERKLDIAAFPLSAERLAGLIAEQKATGVSRQLAGEVYARMLEAGGSAKEVMAQLGVQATDAGQLLAIVRDAIAANPQAVADFKKGKAAAANRIKGAVMKQTKGAANPEVVERILMEELQKA
jgi:aspartyl-tRNA(Asn)/glutamyl-tRNA(Gln) amidotransferase subunit B